MSTCATVWCDRDAIARGLCKRCYDRYRRGISPISPTKRHAVAEDKARLRDEITMRREAGQSIADIAAAVGVNTSTASRWLLEWDFEAGLTADELEELRRRQRKHRSTKSSDSRQTPESQKRSVAPEEKTPQSRQLQIGFAHGDHHFLFGPGRHLPYRSTHARCVHRFRHVRARRESAEKDEENADTILDHVFDRSATVVHTPRDSKIGYDALVKGAAARGYKLSHSEGPEIARTHVFDKIDD